VTKPAIHQTIAADKTWTGMQQAIISEADNMINLPPLERIQIGRRPARQIKGSDTQALLSLLRLPDDRRTEIFPARRKKNC
jgi:hypothetical protein